MKRDVLVIFVMAVVAIGIGAGVFFYGQDVFLDTGASSSAAAALVPFDKIVTGTKSSVSTRVNYLITSEAELATLWTMIDATGAPPKINFLTDNVVAVFAGTKPTSGYGITVSSIEDASARVVTIKLENPAQNCVHAQVITEPYEIVMVPKTTLPFAHEDVVETIGCTD